MVEVVKTVEMKKSIRRRDSQAKQIDVEEDAIKDANGSLARDCRAEEKVEETINLALDDATNEDILLMAQNKELKTKEHGGAKDDGDSREVVEIVGNDICSGFGEILIAETRKSKKDEPPDNREPGLEERELQWRERQYEEGKRKRIRVEEKMEEEKKNLEMKIESGRASEGRERYRDANSTERLTRHMIEIITSDKKLEEAKMKVENFVMDLRRELSKLKEAMTSESNVAENERNEELVSQMGCSREAPNEV
ncbi:uncharacterized protein LOC111438881 [Cucurbita moschata]|uniref:Uncharacterized protein LOC111438881 n=1 Tax=Cucurbita moschata TaxID=3662 RepID=A0A6J1EX29_CUCMO|nr:uncharacterized protein LOC111438881 [Cucurbita moschata]